MSDDPLDELDPTLRADIEIRSEKAEGYRDRQRGSGGDAGTWSDPGAWVGVVAFAIEEKLAGEPVLLELSDVDLRVLHDLFAGDRTPELDELRYVLAIDEGRVADLLESVRSEWAEDRAHEDAVELWAVTPEQALVELVRREVKRRSGRAVA